MQTRFMLVLTVLFTLGACDAAGEEGDACLADGDCVDGLVCHKDEHEHEHEGEAAEADEDGHEDEGGVCEPKGDGHDHDHDHDHNHE